MEDEIKNRIITISGEPVSGKSTTIKAIIKKLEESGISEQNIHLIQTGEKFRKYFNKCIDIVRSINDIEQLQELTKTEEMQRLMGDPTCRAALIRTIAAVKESGRALEDFSIEDAIKNEVFSELRKVVDKVIDTEIKQLGEKINEQKQPNEVWLIDSRLAFHNIPDSFSIRLTTMPRIAGERLFNDKNRGKEDNKYRNVNEAIKARESRRKGERDRYIRRYGVDLEDEENYDLIIDTSFSTVEDISNTILKCEDFKRKGKFFCKKWASPKTFLPLQQERETYSGLEKILQSVKKEGYHANMDISVIEVDGVRYIQDGHHRVAACGKNKITLMPYYITGKDDGYIEDMQTTARQFASKISIGEMMGHEGFFDEPGKTFSYKEIYPELFQKLHEEYKRNSGR